MHKSSGADFVHPQMGRGRETGAPNFSWPQALEKWKCPWGIFPWRKAGRLRPLENRGFPSLRGAPVTLLRNHYLSAEIGNLPRARSSPSLLPPLGPGNSTHSAEWVPRISIRFPTHDAGGIMLYPSSFASLSQCGYGESNPDLVLGKDAFYH